MKIKSYGALIASLILVSFAGYIAPAIAEDTPATDQAPAMNSMPSQDNNNNSNPQNSNVGSSNDTSNTNSGSGSSSTPSGEEGSPDTPTGDDDY